MADQMMNPDDPRPTYVQIADKLRRDYEPGGRLSSAPKIAEEWGVAKETVRAAIDVLRSEGLIASWQGRGTFYRTKAEPSTEEPPTIDAQLVDRLMSRLDDFENRLAALEHSQGPRAAD